MMRYFVRAIAIVSLCVVAASCGHDSPTVRDDGSGRPSGGAQQPPSGPGQRPGVSDSNDLSHELSDDVWRVVGPDMTLRYDRAGVLFNKKADGTIEVHDLDGADRVAVVTGTEGADSLLTGASVTVNGRSLDTRLMKMLKRGDGRTWYTLAAGPDDGRWIFVLP